MTRADHIRTNCHLRWDHRLGLSGFGLVFYGALPASLGALGAFKAPDQGSLNIGAASAPFVLIVAVVPVLLTFVLTRQRLANWYVLRDYLPLRSIVITASIVFASTSVCLATRILSKPDIPLAFCDWLALPLLAKTNAIWHAMLLSFAYLVGSSTLLLTVIKEDSNLPLLPRERTRSRGRSARRRPCEIGEAVSGRA